MPEYTNAQLHLMQIRKEFCKGKSAELARKINKDATYVNRLFYPAGKKGAKGIGLEIMQACTAAFDLPPGYWESAALQSTDEIARYTNSNHLVSESVAREETVIPWRKPAMDKWTKEALEIFARLNEAQRAACVVQLRTYEAAVGPPRTGQAL